jgi:hypothetical protein
VVEVKEAVAARVAEKEEVLIFRAQPAILRVATEEIIPHPNKKIEVE